MQPTKQQLIESLQLEAHVEGGYFRRTFQSEHRIHLRGNDGDDGNDGPGSQPDGGNEQHCGGRERYLMTSIFYLLTDDSRIGHWHCNRSDIVHYFHLGSPIDYYLIHPDGRLARAVMGPDIGSGQRLQFTVPGGVWKASHLSAGEYGLISEAVAPGFDYHDMTLGEPATLTALFPQHRALIDTFTRSASPPRHPGP